MAASAALSHAEPARAATAVGAGDEVAAASDEGGKGAMDQLGDAIRVRNAGGCGCAPCWGPPAPPPMRAELLEEGLS